MIIGVISDTHGSLTAWREAYQKFLQNTNLIIHCGDVLYHGPRNPLPAGYDPKNLAAELNSLSKPLYIVQGNCDAQVDQLVLEYPLESPFAHILTPEIKILAHHGHHWSPETTPAKISGLYDIIISGHTHLPEIRQIGRTIFLNPGSPALPKDEADTPTIALIDHHLIKIMNIASGQPVQIYEFHASF
jgi:phosphoesterase, MJ0936 family